MTAGGQEVAKSTRGLVSMQFGIGLITSGVFAFTAGLPEALAALYGMALSMATAALLGRKVAKAGEQSQENQKHGAVTLYIGAVQRFVFVLAFLALGMGVLKLAALPIMVGFALTQLAFVIGSFKMSRANS